MPRIVDNLIAYKVLSMLVTPFTETPAFKLGIIDKDGNNLIKTSKLEGEQKDAYTYLTRLVFNIKKILNKLPGGDNKTKNLIAALWLVKESYNSRTTPLTEDVNKLIKMLDTVTLVEEEIEVNYFFEARVKEDSIGGGGVATMGIGAPGGTIPNITGAGVSTDEPAIKPKDLYKYKKKNAGVLSLTRRASPVK
jgi:hypothetical protein